MSKKSPFKVRRAASGDMALQITSMADIFIILLVFILKSFNSGGAGITPSPGMQLASAFTDKAQIEALNMEISQTAIQVDNKPVTPLKDFRFLAEDLQGNGMSQTLDTALERQKKRQELIAGANTDVEVDSKILIVADARTPYRTIQTALANAAIHGFSDFKLVVKKKD